MKFNIVTLTEEHLAHVFMLVKELADFEKAPESVVTTVEQYHTLYKDGLFQGLVAEQGGKVVGMAIFYPIFSTWTGRLLYLEDFYVQPHLRGSGIGQALFDQYLETARHGGYTGGKWEVLDWNSGAIRFYERNGATIDKGWYNGRLYF